jgi:hypothetical protein
MATEKKSAGDLVMAVRTSSKRAGGWWAMWAFSAAVVSLVLVEASAGMEYVGAGLEHGLATVLGWTPALSILPVQVAEQSIWHWGTVEVVLRAVPLSALGVLLVVLVLSLGRQYRVGRPQKTKR